MKESIADIHVHSGMKGFVNEQFPENGNRTIWDFYPRKEKALKELNFAVRGAIRELAKDSQAHLNGCAEAKLMVPFISICPAERQMFALERRPPFRRLLQIILPERKYAALGAAVSGFPKEWIQRILDKNVFNDSDDGVDYYEQYREELKYLLRQTEISSSVIAGFRFQIAKNYKDFKRLVRTGNSIVGILTVEGAHSFGHYKRHSTLSKTFDELDPEEKRTLGEAMLRNIKEVKGDEYSPFFVTFCHHFNNLLAGHARSMSGKSNLISFLPWPNLPGMRHIFNQEPNLNAGFSELGREVIALLLDRKQGRRLLIDTKHMSLAARREYYDFVKQKREEENDPIPIICSHAAVNGWPSLEEARRHPEIETIDKDTFFSRWQINLTDEDILAIYDSDGIIGIVLHEGRMPGDDFKKMAKRLKKRIKKLARKNNARARRKKAAYENRLKNEYLQLIWSNIFYIVKVIHDARQSNGRPADGWKLIALGSDFDGIINPFNTYPSVSHFVDLKKEMVEYLKSGQPVRYAVNGRSTRFSTEELRKLMGRKTPEQLIDRIFFGNAERFLKKYFTGEYLERKTAADRPITRRRLKRKSPSSK